MIARAKRLASAASFFSRETISTCRCTNADRPVVIDLNEFPGSMV